MNETINQVITETGKKILYEEWIEITQSVPFVIASVFIFVFISLGLYILIAGNIRARTSGGTTLKGSMLSHRNAIVPIVVWIITVVAYIFLIIFPYWIKLF